MENTSIPKFKVVGSKYISQWLNENPKSVVEAAESAYLMHADSKTVSPDSYFLRFPDNTRDRIIALPASLEAEQPITGIKWISSFPDNINKQLNRASAVIIVNDRNTGYPVACLEGSLISAARTAASAVIGAKYLHSTPGKIKRLGVVGCGPISFSTVDLLVGSGWEIEEMYVADLSKDRSSIFRNKCKESLVSNSKSATLEETITTSDLILIATSATVPYILSPEWFKHAPTVLHMSLRDLAPEIILSGQNVADDIEHSLKSQTSTHLASQQVGHSDFMAGGIADVIRNKVTPDLTRTRIYSPFGMGILDLAVAQKILNTADKSDVTEHSDFFPEAYTN